jgi:YD repeat-containing protein
MAYDLHDHVSSKIPSSITQQVRDAIGKLTSDRSHAKLLNQNRYYALNRLIQTLDAVGRSTAHGYETNDRLSK